MIVRPLFGVFAAALLMVGPGTASAALTVTLVPSNQTFNAGTAASGFFDVFVTGTSATPDQVSGYVNVLDIVGPSTGVTFDLIDPVDVSPAAPDIFPTAPEPTPIINTGSRLSYFDNDLVTPTAVTSSTTFSAGRFFFEIAASATPGTYDFVFDETPVLGSGYINAAGVDFLVDFNGGSITIVDPAAIPEPSSMLLLGMTGIAAVAVRRFRRKGSETTTAA